MSAPHSRPEKVTNLWKDFRAQASTFYDVLLWQHEKWPVLSLAWVPQSSWSKPAAVAAAEEDSRQWRQDDLEVAATELAQSEGSEDEDTSMDDAGDDESHPEPAAAAAGSRDVKQQQQQQPPKQLVAMPVEYHYLLMGTQTSGAGENHIVLSRVEVPGQLPDSFDPQQQQVVLQEGVVQPVLAIRHGLLDVNRLAVMPSNPNIVCTCTDDPEVYLFDLLQHQSPAQGHLGAAAAADAQVSGASKGSSADSLSTTASDASKDESSGDLDDVSNDSPTPVADVPPNPQAVLTGRSAGGFALEFNPVKAGLLLGADLQGGVQLWDVEGSSSSSNGAAGRIKPVQAVEKFVPCGINDASWHRHGTAYALATESGQVWVQDLRQPATQPSSSSSRHGLTSFVGQGVAAPATAQLHVQRQRHERAPQQQEQQQGEQQHQEERASAWPHDCYTVAFDPCHDYRLASGGADGYVYVLDMRRLDQPLQTLRLHAGSVTSLSWSTRLAGLLVSASEDGNVLLWDANKMRHAPKLAKHSYSKPQHGPAQRGDALQQQQQQQRHLGLPPAPVYPQLRMSIDCLGRPGLLFIHGGHLPAAVSAVALNPDRPWLMASATAAGTQAVDARGRTMEHQPLMVWEVNRAYGLLC